MKQPSWVAGVAGLAACAPAGSYQGRLVDGATGKPRANERILARAFEGGDITCQMREATTGADGAFSFTETCAKHRYRVQPADKTLALETDETFAGGEPVASRGDLAAWRTPKGEGVYVIADDVLNELRKAADVYWEPMFFDKANPESYEEARYPSVIPDRMPSVPPGGFLALAGDAITDLRIHPLIEKPGPVQFPRPAGMGTTYTIRDAWWVGLRFSGEKVTGPASVERVTATLDESKVKDLEGKGWKTRLIAAEALPPGRYALLGDRDSRMYLVSFGTVEEAVASGAAAN